MLNEKSHTKILNTILFYIYDILEKAEHIGTGIRSMVARGKANQRRLDYKKGQRNFSE